MLVREAEILVISQALKMSTISARALAPAQHLLAEPTGALRLQVVAVDRSLVLMQRAVAAVVPTHARGARVLPEVTHVVAMAAVQGAEATVVVVTEAHVVAEAIAEAAQAHGVVEATVEVATEAHAVVEVTAEVLHPEAVAQEVEEDSII